MKQIVKDETEVSSHINFEVKHWEAFLLIVTVRFCYLSNYKSNKRNDKILRLIGWFRPFPGIKQEADFLILQMKILYILQQLQIL